MKKASTSHKQGAGMDVREIKALIALMRENELVELEIEGREGRVRLVRGDLKPPEASRAAPPTPAPRQAAPSEQAAELAPNQVNVASPMVGTFYRSASPDAPPFVTEGDTVRKGQPLCIVEAMKMMNEIEAEVSGRVLRVLVENGQPVQYGQPLMVIETS
jgi:acetyl-CoA carboxylase biotin carboxyl carrier protein